MTTPTATSSRSLPRRRQWPQHLLALLVVDHASVWRSTPLRRGVLVLVLVPGVVAALAGMSWQSLILVPGLIAAGAGLLFGINAFTLDSTGSVWLSTLPEWSTPAFLAKSLVFFEVALAAVLSALVGGSLRAPLRRRRAEVTAAVTSARLLRPDRRRHRDALVAAPPTSRRPAGPSRHPGHTGGDGSAVDAVRHSSPPSPACTSRGWRSPAPGGSAARCLARGAPGAPALVPDERWRGPIRTSAPTSC